MQRQSSLIISTIALLFFLSACGNNPMNGNTEENGSESVKQIIEADYSEIIAQYQIMADCGYDSEVYDREIEEAYENYCYISNTLIYLGKTQAPEIQYAIHDINGDSVKELILAGTDDTIYDVFSYDENGPVSLFGAFFDETYEETSKYPKTGMRYDSSSLGYRQRVCVNSDGTIIHLAYTGTSNRSEKMKLPEYSCELCVLEGVRDENKMYYRLNGDGTETPCSEEEYISSRNDLEKEYEDHDSKMVFTFTKIVPEDSSKATPEPISSQIVTIPNDALTAMLPVARARCEYEYFSDQRHITNSFWECMENIGRYENYPPDYYHTKDEYPLYVFLPTNCFIDAGYACFKDFSGNLNDYPLSEYVIYDPSTSCYGFENVGSEIRLREIESTVTSDTTAVATYEVASEPTNELLGLCDVCYVYNPHVKNAKTKQYYYTIESITFR